MAKTPFNIQDQYLNQARKERVRVSVTMMSGEKLEGYHQVLRQFLPAHREQRRHSAVQTRHLLDHFLGRFLPFARGKGLIRRQREIFPGSVPRVPE